MKAIQIVLLLLSVRTSLCQPENVAPRGVATQSQTENSPFGAASNAIDGNKNPDFQAGSCSATKAHHSPWWRLDLLARHRIYQVKVFNRQDCGEIDCEVNLEGVEVRFGEALNNEGNDNHLLGVLPSVAPGQFGSIVLQEGGLEGRFLNIRVPCMTRSLSLCEVEVFGYPTTTANLALSGKASQSSQYEANHAMNAIDGNTEPNVRKGSCQHTKVEDNPWWRLDLTRRHTVLSVKVFNRLGVTSTRLDGAEIRVGNSLDNNGNSNAICATITNIPSAQSESFQCDPPGGMEGRYVNIYLVDSFDHLTVCEVEVYGFPVEETF